MWISAFWKYLTRRRRRASFYDTQLTSGHGVDGENLNFSLFPDKTLEHILEFEPNTLRAEAAHHELEKRAHQRRQTMSSNSEASAH